MSINSSEPTRLVGYTETVASPVGQSRTATMACRDAVFTHNGTNPSFPVDTSAIATATALLADIRSILTETRVVAAAFDAADRSGGPIRTASTTGLTNAIGTIIAAHRATDEGSGAGADTSSERPDGIYGFYRDGEKQHMIGGHRFDMRGDVLLGVGWQHDVSGIVIGDGKLGLDTTFEGFVGGRSRGEASTDFGPGSAHLVGELFGGARADGGLSVEAGRDGVAAKSGIDLHAGVTAKGEIELDAGPASAGLECEGGFGAGFTAEAEAEISKDRIGFSFDYATIWGAGGGCKVSLEVDPGEAIDFLREGAEVMHQTAKPALDAAGDVWDSSWEFGKSLLGRPTTTVNLVSALRDGLD